jgi:hypothetical protein
VDTLGSIVTGKNFTSLFALETNGREQNLQTFGSQLQEYKVFHPRFFIFKCNLLTNSGF